MGTDIDERVLRVARHNAEQAGVGGDIHFQCMPVGEISSKRKYGKIICNPPMGNASANGMKWPNCTRKLPRPSGDLIPGRTTFSPPTLLLRSSSANRHSKRRKLYNGNIEVQYYQYYGPRPPRIHRSEGTSE